MPPNKVLENAKRARTFISSKVIAFHCCFIGAFVEKILIIFLCFSYVIVVLQGYPRYCTASVMPDGSVVLSGARSKRGKMRGPPGSRSWNTALKNMVSYLAILQLYCRTSQPAAFNIHEFYGLHANFFFVPNFVGYQFSEIILYFEL